MSLDCTWHEVKASPWNIDAPSYLQEGKAGEESSHAHRRERIRKARIRRQLKGLLDLFPCMMMFGPAARIDGEPDCHHLVLRSVFWTSASSRKNYPVVRRDTVGCVWQVMATRMSRSTSGGLYLENQVSTSRSLVLESFSTQLLRFVRQYMTALRQRYSPSQRCGRTGLLD